MKKSPKDRIKKYAYGGGYTDDGGGDKKKSMQNNCPEGDCRDRTLHLNLPTLFPRRASRVDPREALLNEIHYPGVGTNRYYPVTSFDPQPDKEIPQFPSNTLTGVSYRPSNSAAYGGKFNTGGIVEAAPNILNTIIGLLDNNQSYSRQPIVNSSAVRNMSNPYSRMAMGGSIDDLDEGEQMQLQQMANQYGMEPEDMYQMLMEQQQQQQNPQDLQDESDIAGNGDSSDEQDLNEEEGDSNQDDGQDMSEYKYGGFHINPAHKGFCTPMTKSTCTGKRRQFAINAKHHFKKQHAMGGTAINVEGKEVLQRPGQSAMKISGPSHENGGVDKVVPDGTKIYSDRLAIDGVAMNDRKIKREARLKKLNKLVSANPTDKLLKNSIQRTAETIQNEDKQDMALQKMANQIYQPPQESKEVSAAYGGTIKKYGVGGDVDPLVLTPRGQYEDYGYDPQYTNPGGNTALPGNPLTYSDTGNTNPAARNAMIPDHGNPGDMTIGDYVGMVGTGFNAVAPIINTNQAFRATPPSINRYKGVGAKALDANQSAQTYVAGIETNANTNLDTSSNSRYIRNANSATDVNVLRGLDAGIDMGVDKSRNAINDSYGKEMVGLLTDRERLLNTKDQYEAYGATGRDDRETANIDNYFSNRGANLINFGREVQIEGKNLNTSYRNRMDSNLLSQLSRYGLEFDENENIVNKKTTT